MEKENEDLRQVKVSLGRKLEEREGVVRGLERRVKEGEGKCEMVER